MPTRASNLLVKAIGLNPRNPLCNIGLVQLYTENRQGTGGAAGAGTDDIR
jgi:hypothetical protein